MVDIERRIGENGWFAIAFARPAMASSERRQSMPMSKTVGKQALVDVLFSGTQGNIGHCVCRGN
jgi:hypothetical protein